jgi:hypothetical protein
MDLLYSFIMKVTKAYKSVRRSWGQINPITRVVQSKKEYKRKSKFKNNSED